MGICPGRSILGLAVPCYIGAALMLLAGKAPEVKAIHAGLECGIIGEKLPGLECVSYGPTITCVNEKGRKAAAANGGGPLVAARWHVLHAKPALLALLEGILGPNMLMPSQCVAGARTPLMRGFSSPRCRLSGRRRWRS